MQTVTSSEFNRQIGKMKQACFTCPVIITERGEAAYVLLSFEYYEKLANEVLPAYEADDGDLTNEQIAAIRKAMPQNKKSVK